MATSQVATAALVSASDTLARTGFEVEGGRSSLMESRGGLAGTPAAVAFAAFVEAADGAVTSLETRADGLCRALVAEAATSSVADATTTGGVEVRG